MRLSAIEDIEDAVIGWALNNSDQFSSVSDKLVPDDFIQNHVGQIWRCFSWLESNQKSITPETVNYRLEQIGYPQFQEHVLAASNLRAIDTTQVKTYIELVSSDSQRRRLAETLKRYTGIVESAKNTPLSSLIHEIEIALTSSQPAQSAPEPSMGDAVKAVLESQERIKDGEHPRRASLGLDALNEATGGGKPKEMVVIAGRPSNGKTLLAIRSALENAILRQSPTLMFSLEMGREQIIQRCLATLGGIPFSLVETPTDEKLKAHGISWADYKAAIQGAADVLMSCPLHVDDRSEHTEKHPSALLKTAKRWHAHFGGLGQIITDYLQLVTAEPGIPFTTEERTISYASKMFKGMAKSLNTNVVVLSQLNRNIERRDNPRPLMSDLRGSGAIEEDADAILFVHQDQIYNPDTPIPNTLEIQTGKLRNGALGTIYADLDLPTCSIINLSGEEMMERQRQVLETKKTSATQKKPPRNGADHTKNPR